MSPILISRLYSRNSSYSKNKSCKLNFGSRQKVVPFSFFFKLQVFLISLCLFCWSSDLFIQTRNNYRNHLECVSPDDWISWGWEDRFCSTRRTDDKSFDFTENEINDNSIHTFWTLLKIHEAASIIVYSRLLYSRIWFKRAQIRLIIDGPSRNQKRACSGKTQVVRGYALFKETYTVSFRYTHRFIFNAIRNVRKQCFKGS